MRVECVLEWPSTWLQLREVGPVGTDNLEKQEIQSPCGCAG